MAWAVGMTVISVRLTLQIVRHAFRVPHGDHDIVTP